MLMPKSIEVHIASPCHENWNEMTANEQGAFCKSCQKNVIDFSTKTQNEIYDIVTLNSGGLCGRFREDQLNEPVIKSEIHSNLFNWKAIAASLAALIAADKNINAKDTAPRPPVTCSSHVVKGDVKITRPMLIGDTVVLLGKPSVMKKDTTAMIVIKGIVVDEKTKYPLENAAVMTDESDLQTIYTDKDGNFILTLPEDFKGKVSFIGNYQHYGKDINMKDLLKMKGRKTKNGKVIIGLEPHPIQMIMGRFGALKVCTHNG
jgi:hypothetical protein